MLVICALISAIGTQTWEVMMEYDREEACRRALALDVMLQLAEEGRDIYDAAVQVGDEFKLPAYRVLKDFDFWTKE